MFDVGTCLVAHKDQPGVMQAMKELTAQRQRHDGIVGGHDGQ